MNHCCKTPHQILPCWDTKFFHGRSLVCVLLPGKLIKLSFSTSPKTLSPRFFFFKLHYTRCAFIYLLVAVLDLRFCARAFSSCGKRGPLFITVRGPLTIAASLVAEHRLQMRRLSSCGSRAQLLRGMWDPPRPGLEPVSPALAGRLSTTAPPGKPYSKSKSCSVGQQLCCFSSLIWLV